MSFPRAACAGVAARIYLALLLINDLLYPCFPNAVNMANNDNTTFLVGKRFPNRLFVGGLPPNTEAVELAEYFSQYGSVTDAKVIADDKNVSKGYGFVTFKSTADVKNVWQNGTLFFKDKKLNIGPAVKKEGPMIEPEVVIVPKAPSKGAYYYPSAEPAPQYITIEPCYAPEQCYAPEPFYTVEPCYIPEPLCYTFQPCYAPELCYAPETCLGYYPYQVCPPLISQQCYQQPLVMQAPNNEAKVAPPTITTKRRRRTVPPRFKEKRSS